MQRSTFGLLLVSSLSMLLTTPARALPPAADTQLTTESWKANAADFEACNQRIQSMATRNLLGREGVRVTIDGKDHGDAILLADGDAGTREAEGRVFLGADRPAEVVYYLGSLKAIHEVGLFSFNGDTRANQDYEVRFADNSRHPGIQPNFDEKPSLTTGDKILGQNGGGFHSRFAAAKGGPIATADWVQFRIWPTLGRKAGEQAKVIRGQGQAVVVELEVLGGASDVVAPSKEEVAYRQALRTTPKQPDFVKRATWQETLIASREAILQWETQQDVLAMHNVPLTLGPWYLLGPISPKSKELSKIRGSKHIDLAERYAAAEATPISWQPCEDLKDGRINDLSGYRGADKDAIFFACREVVFHAETKSRELYAGLWADQGQATWLPDRQNAGLQGSAVLHAGSEVHRQAGTSQLLVELRAGAGGQRRFLFLMKSAASRPGAGPVSSRASLRRQLLGRVRAECAAPSDQAQLDWETESGIWADSDNQAIEDWLPGNADAYLKAKYRAAIDQRLQKLTAMLDESTGVKAMALAESKPEAQARNAASEGAPACGSARSTASPAGRGKSVKDRIAAWIVNVRNSLASDLGSTVLRGKFYQVAVTQDTIALAGRVRSMRLAVEDHREMFKGRYPKAAAFLDRIAVLDGRMQGLWAAALSDNTAVENFTSLKQDLDRAQTEILLDTPLLAFGKLLLAKGNPGFNSNWGGPNHIGHELVVLSPIRPDGRQTTIYKGNVSDMDLNWDGKRLLFSDGHALWEVNADGSGLRRVSAADPPITHYDGCYMPNGQVVCVSNACEQAVPCTGQADVGNLHILDADGKNEHRVSFDQDHDWNPVVLNDGRILYSRWEYADLPHYFSRMLFRMNPDGSGQMEYYGSGSYWPNAMYWPRPIPGHPTEVVCIVSGHHGVGRAGELLVLDPARGRHEADGVVQRIPGYQQKVEPVIMDQLVTHVWPRFAAPYPLADPGTNLGAGKYFLACVQRNAFSSWDLYLVDKFDNLTPILTGGYMTPIPLAAQAHAAGHSLDPRSAPGRRDHLPGRHLQGRRAAGLPAGFDQGPPRRNAPLPLPGQRRYLCLVARRRLGRQADPGHGACQPGRLGPLPRAGEHAHLPPAAGRRRQVSAADAELVHGDGRRNGVLRRLPRAAEPWSAGQVRRRRDAAAGANHALERPAAGVQLRARSPAGARPPLRRLPQRPALQGRRAANRHGRLAGQATAARLPRPLQPRLPGLAEVRSPGRL